jgi:hypothetical protein
MELILPAYVAMAGRHDKPISTRFLDPIDCSKIMDALIRTKITQNGSEWNQEITKKNDCYYIFINHQSWIKSIKNN